MAAKRTDSVNLDALIPRLDFETKSQTSSSGGGNEPIPISELALGKLHYRLLRKPFFQRDTDDWSIDHVVTLIKSVRDGDLIPALILWRGDTNFTFVIDGAHRLSALIAWVNNDYGDGNISRAFNNGHIPRRQIEIGKECRRLVESEVGAHATLSNLLLLPSPTAEQVRISANISRALVTQTVFGDSDTAAKSFLAINQRSVQIDQTEKYMIEHMNDPNVIAARALVRSAKGWQNWSKFSHEKRESIQAKAQRIYNAIYEPEDADPESSLDLQPAGPAYTANGMRLALELVGLVNGLAGSQQVATAATDVDGEKTERQIEKTLGVVKYIAGKDPSSLSLHPAVYFWGETGNHQPNTFLAVVSFIQDLVAQDALVEFVKIRAQFEEFLLSNSGVRTAILAKYGSWKKNRAPINKMLRVLFDGLKAGKNSALIEAEILKEADSSENDLPSGVLYSGAKNTWRETRAALRRKASLESARRCPLCQARMVMSDASGDHKQRRADGGNSSVGNAQLTHQYCNTGFKEHFAQKRQPLPEIPSPV